MSVCAEDSPGSGGGCGCGSVEDGEVLTSGTKVWREGKGWECEWI